jgi:hypothetical protein
MFIFTEHRSMTDKLPNFESEWSKMSTTIQALAKRTSNHTYIHIYMHAYIYCHDLGVTIEDVWIGEKIYLPLTGLTTNSCNTIADFHTLQITKRQIFSSFH